MHKTVNWKKVKSEYIQGHISMRELAKKYDISFSTLSQVAAREKWTELKNKTREKIDTKMSEVAADKEIQKINKFQFAADLLLDKIIEGIKNGTFVQNSRVLKDITGALKDIKDIKGLKSEADIREQEARIKKLEKEAENTSENRDNEIIVVFEGENDDC